MRNTTDHAIMKNPNSKWSNAFGFVTFATVKEVVEARNRKHTHKKEKKKKTQKTKTQGRWKSCETKEFCVKRRQEDAQRPGAHITVKKKCLLVVLKKARRDIIYELILDTIR